MTTQTTDQGLLLPTATDAANVPLSFSNLTSSGTTGGMESRLVKRYLSTADRTVRNPTPQEGELVYLLDVNKYEYYTGATWAALTPTTVITKDADEVLVNSTTFQNDNDIFFTAEPNGKYEGTLTLLYSSENSADFKWQFVFPSGTMSFMQLGPDTGTNQTATPFETTVRFGQGSNGASPQGSTLGGKNTGGGNQFVEGAYIDFVLYNGGSSGTCQLQWAKNATGAGLDCTVYKGTKLRYSRVA